MTQTADATRAVWATCGPRLNGWSAGPPSGATAGPMFAPKVGADDRWADRAGPPFGGRDQDPVPPPHVGQVRLGTTGVAASAAISGG